MSKRLVPVLLVLMVIAIAVQPAAAQNNKFKIFAGMSYVSPLSDDDIDVEGVTEAVEASSEVGYTIGFEWRLGELMGIELDYLDATHDVEIGGVVVGETGMAPLSATLNFHLINTKLIDLYLGPTVSYVSWDDIELTDGDSVPTDSETAFGASLGIDIGLGERFAIIGGLRYLQLDVTPEDGDGLAVDPLFARLGLAYRF